MRTLVICQLTFDDIDEWLVVNQILLRVCGLKYHDSTKLLWISALKDIDQVNHIIWRDVHLRVVSECSQRRSRKTDVKLHILVQRTRPDKSHPGVERDRAWLITNASIRGVKVRTS